MPTRTCSASWIERCSSNLARRRCHRCGAGGSYPRRRIENRFYLSPEISRVSGNHTITAGVSINRVQINDLQSDNVRGQLDFTRNFGRSAIENFLLGTPTTFTIGIGNFYRGFRNWQDAFYFQDVMRIRRNVTLSLGMRYEVITAPSEVNGLTQIPFSSDANNFGPVAGFAWNPSPKTVIRGGYQLAFGEIFPLLYGQARFNPPQIRTFTVDNPDLLNPTANIQPTSAARVIQLSPDLVSPYTHLYNLGIERELPGNLLFRVAYIGNRTMKIPVRSVSNRAQPTPGIPTTTATINQRRPDPRYLEISTYTNMAIGYFDGVQVGIDKRMSRGLALNLRYTFSKAISSADTTFNNIAGGLHVSQDANIVAD